MLKKIIGVLCSWEMLAVEGVGLIWISWPWANHLVSLFWAIVFVSVLIGELISKIFSPKKQTISNVVRDAGIYDKIRFWLMVSTWLVFSVTLALHFCSKLFFGVSP